MCTSRARCVTVTVALLVVACGPPREVIRIGVGGATHPPAHEAGLDPASPHAWLWRVSGGDAARPSYLLGTIHLGVAFRDAVPEPLDTTLFDARALVMEVDLREAERFFASTVGEPLPRSHWLDHTLGEGSWQHLLAELGGRAPAELLRQIPPGALVSYLQQVRMAEVEAIEDHRTPVVGATSSTRLDRSIFHWAVTAGTPIVALETPEEAMAALASLPQAGALEALRTIVDDPDAARLEARRLRDAYLSLDVETLEILMAEAPPDFQSIVLEGRNRAWMARLLPELRTGNTLVAVGCGHLVGPNNLRSLLEAEGYIVERVLGDGGLVPSGRDDIRIH